MKHLLSFVAMMGLTTSVAFGGPNAGGVLWVHDTGIVYTTDLTQPIVSTPPADCAGVDNEQPLDGVRRVWKVYAAFPPGSAPRLKGTAWGIQFPQAPADPYVLIDVAGCGLPNENGAGTDFSIPELGFPTSSGGQMGQSFPLPRLTTVVELFYFTGFAYSPSGTGFSGAFQTAPHSAEMNRVFLDDATPQHADPIMGYGSLGFGTAGSTPCPEADPSAACCAPGGDCTITKQSECPPPSSWHLLYPTCEPNPCLLPSGACCWTNGQCDVVLELECGQGGGTYEGDLTSCAPSPCPAAGACCPLSGGCLIRTEIACASLNPPGAWHPEWTVCDPNPCPPPPPPELRLVPDSVAVTTGGDAEIPQPVLVQNDGAGILEWTCQGSNLDLGYALDFDGVNDYFSSPDNSSWDPVENGDVLTVEAWIRVDGWYDNAWFSIIDKGAGWTVQLNRTSGVTWIPRSGPSLFLNWIPQLGRWYHFALTSNRSLSTVKVFVDGQLVDTKTFAGDIASTTGPLYVGYNPFGSAEYVNGALDELRVWSVERSPAEIASDMYRTGSGPEAGLVGYWPMDEGTGSSVADVSGNGNNGTLSGGQPWFRHIRNTTPPWLSVPSAGGTVLPGQADTLGVTIRPGEVEPGKYDASVHLTSNDPDEPEPRLPVLLRKTDPKANLRVTGLIAADSIEVGEPVNVRWTAVNEGDDMAQAPWVDRVYLSGDSLSWTGDPLGETTHTGDLDLGQSYSDSLVVYLPLAAEGPRYLVVVTDAANQVDEGPHEEDNGRSRPIVVRLPDLVVTEVTAPRHGYTEQSVTVAWSVTNTDARKIARGPWRDQVVLSPDPIFGNSDDVESLTLEFPDSLAPGQTYQRSGEVILPSTAAQYFVLVRTDDGEQVLEAGSAANNVGQADSLLSVIVQPKPDLVVAEVIAPSDGVLSGAQTEASFLIRNVDTGPTLQNYWRDRVRLVADTLQSGGTDLGSFANLTFLMPDSGYVNTVPVTLPQDVSGTYYLRIKTDDRSEVAERIETNNVRHSRSFRIDLAPQPDLRAIRPLSVNLAFSGTLFSVDWADSNRGDGTTDTGVWTDRVYLSQNNSGSITTGDRLIATVQRSGEPLPGGGVTQNLHGQGVIPIEFEGDYFVKIQVDVNGAVSEFGWEGNNVTVGETPVNVMLGTPPDLVATGISGPAEGLAGHLIDVEWSVTNDGAPPPYALTWQDAVYLSPDPQFDSLDVRLGLARADALANPDGTWRIDPYSRVRSLRIPNGTAEGTYYLIVWTDALRQVFEHTLETNNFRTAAQAIQIYRTPSDLTIEVGFDPERPLPTSGAAGQQIPLLWRARNDGGAVTAVDAWHDRAFLATDSGGGGAIQMLEVPHNGYLHPGGHYLVERTAAVPLVAPGDYYLCFRVDARGVVPEEGGETNNLVAAPFVVTGAAADLVADSLSVVDSASSGQTIDISWVVRNAGTRLTNVSAWSDRVYLSRTRKRDDSAILLGIRGHSGVLQPQTSYVVQSQFVLPIDLSGLFHVLVLTDQQGQVYESNEDNNLLTHPIVLDVELTPPGNLVTEWVQAADEAIAGQALQVSWRVTNVGTGPTSQPTWYDGIYLSRDTYLDLGSDTYLGEIRHDGYLDTGEWYEVTRDIVLPGNAAGLYFVLVRSDRRGAVFENGLEEDNDESTTMSTEISVPLPSNLTVTSVGSPSGGGVLGDSTEVVWMVHNAGAEPISGHWIDAVYLSSDPVPGIDDVLLGQFESSTEPVGQLLPGDSLAVRVRGTIPAVLPGEYSWVVRSDVHNQIPETDEGDNAAVSFTPSAIGVDSLWLGIPRNGTMGDGTERHFALTPGAGRTVRIVVEHAAPLAEVEVYARLDGVATAGNFDRSAQGVPGNRQELLLEETREGTYFLMCRTLRGAPPAGLLGFTVQADSVPYSVFSVEPRRCGNAGEVTFRIEGCQFRHENPFFPGCGSSAELVPSGGGDAVDARWTNLISSGRLDATFDLAGVAPGNYDLVVRSRWIDAVFDSTLSPDYLRVDTMLVGESQLPAAVEVVAGGSGVASIQLSMPAQVRRWNVFPISVRFENLGLVDVPSPAFEISSRTGTPLAWHRHPSGYDGSTLQGMVLGGRRADRLAPGEGAAITVYARGQVDAGSRAAFHVNLLGEADTLLDWNSLDGYYRNIGNPDTWPGRWAAFRDSVGGTWNGYLDFARRLAVRSYDVNAPADSERRASTVPMIELVTSELLRGSDEPDREKARDSREIPYLCQGLPAPCDYTPEWLCTLETPWLIAFKSYLWVFHTLGSLVHPAWGQVNYQYLSNTVTTPFPAPPGSAVSESFRKSKDTREAVAEVLKLAADGLALECNYFQELDCGESIYIPLDDLVSAWDMKYRVACMMNYDTTPSEDAALLAGGLGSGETLLDSRQIRGGVTLECVCAGECESKTYRLLPNLEFQIRETYDICPGDLGSPLEAILATAKMRVLEKCRWVGDVEEDILFYVEGESWNPGGKQHFVMIPEECREGCPPEGPGVCAEGTICEEECESSNVPPGGEMCCSTPDCDDGGTDIVQPIDPNDIVGPAGYGPEGWVSRAELPYVVHFENVADATAPAQEVVVRVPLDDDLHTGSFRVGEIRFGDVIVEVPENRSTFQTRVERGDSSTVVVEIVAGVDMSVSPPEALWRLRSLDPDTGLPPVDPQRGFLPPNDESGRGEGSVAFRIKPTSTAGTGSQIEAQAQIVFDDEPTIETNVATNLLDVDPPSSRVLELPPTVDSPEVLVIWQGADGAGGCGIKRYNLYVSVDGLPFELAASGLADTSFAYAGQPGQTVGFFTIAEDNAGNAEAMKTEAEAITHLGDMLAVYPGDANNGGTVTQNDVLAVGLHFGRTGPVREGRDLSWRPQPCAAWDPAEATYVDGTGDGKVSQNDILPIGLNFGATRPAGRESISKSSRHEDAYVEIPPLPVGTEVPIEISLDLTSQTDRRLLGLGGVLEYPQEVLAADSAVVTAILDDGDLLAFHRREKESGRVAFAFARKASSTGVLPQPEPEDAIVRVTLRVTSMMTETARIALSDAAVMMFDGELTNPRVVVGSPLSRGLPLELTVKSIYPNPLKQVATLTFGLPKPSRVTVDLFDVSGRRVSQVIDQVQKSAGWHAVRIDSARLPSGVYFCQLRTAENTKAQKIIVLE